MFPKRLIACVCACVALGCLMSAFAPIDGTFSYQGRLTNSGAAVTGTASSSISDPTCAPAAESS